MSQRMDKIFHDRNTTILNNAETLFRLKGFDKVTMNDIAKESDVAKGTLYLHFKSKEELLFNILIPKLEEFNSEVEIINKKQDLTSDKIKKIITYGFDSDFFDFTKNHFLYMHQLFNVQYHDELKALIDKVIENFSLIIQNGKEKNEIVSSLSNNYLSHQLMHIFDPQIYFSLVEIEKNTKEHFVRNTITFYLNVLNIANKGDC
ncbi:TetR/AcrR family transcriptional regulator [Bacillus sp. SD088]|uniref:TetR/AcrR family transcriptional regulator n=1 Tax=Bacillus sp. SD088 TaxID=2782012 RepID=UPI001A9632C7|nr:TetR/AcrR family transcriptional regulator [Bacillus sp. SD088]MBO0993560.1 TetR/AcrR family transcriptional regulator [Bacillus sp. SD088]